MPSMIPALLAALIAASSVNWTTVNSVSTGDQDTPAVSCNRNGRVAVVWEDDRDSTDPEDDSHSEIYLRTFQDGTPVFEKKLSPGGTSGTNWKHLSPDVGLDDNGNAVVVWSNDPDGNGYFNVVYQVLSPTGTLLASGQANADSAGNQIAPRVAVDPDGTPGNPSAVAFTVVWEDVQTSTVTIRAAGYTAGTTKAYEVAASQATGTHHRPDVAVSASGDATVVWEEDGDGNGYYNIGLVRLAKANGAVTLSRRTADAVTDGQQLRPAIAENYDGDFAVTWQSDQTGANGIWTRSFTSAGTPVTGEVETVSDPQATGPTVGVDDAAAVVLGWTIGGVDGWLRGLNPDGTAAGRLEAQSLTQTATGRQDQFAVAVSAYSEVSICYTDDSDGNGMDQVILGTGVASNEDAA